MDELVFCGFQIEAGTGRQRGRTEEERGKEEEEGRGAEEEGGGTETERGRGAQVTHTVFFLINALGR